MEEHYMKKFDFTEKIEDMSPEQLENRIREGYEAPMPELVAMPYVGNEELVKYIYPELTALCPMTGLQDLYSIEIILIPDKYVPELKSLKFYLMAYRDLPISHEHIASKIFEELHQLLDPKSLEINLDTAIRGGIKTIVEI